MIVGDRASDQLALKDYLLPDLSRAGITPVVKTIASDPTDTATTDAQAPLVVQQLRSAGVTSVIPLIPFNVFYPVLQAETSQNYYPKLLLSDYESSIESALGLIPIPYEKALDGQEGLTIQTLGRGHQHLQLHRTAGLRRRGEGVLDPLAQGLSPDPAGRHHRLHRAAGTRRQLVPGDHAVRHRGQGGRHRPQPAHLRHRPVQDQELPRDLHAHLELRTRTSATARPLYKIVKLRNNVPPSPACQLTSQGKAQGTCWVTVRPFAPLPTG